MTLSSLASKAGKLIADNSPAIMTAIGVSGALTTAYLTGRASFKAGKLIAYEEFEHLEPMPRGKIKSFVLEKKIWQLYIPAASAAVITVGAIVMANRIGTRRSAALAAGYTTLASALERYQDKVVEIVGKNKEQKIRDEVVQDRITNDPIGNREIMIVGNGDQVCYDMHSGRYFKSQMEDLRRAENDLNRTVLHDGYASLGDFYGLIGLPATRAHEELGWTSDQNPMEIKFSGALTPEGVPCMAMDFTVSPVRNYHRIH